MSDKYKAIIYDVFAQIYDINFIIEMQDKKETYFQRRSIFYSSAFIDNEFRPDQKYSTVKVPVTISLLGDTLCSEYGAIKKVLPIYKESKLFSIDYYDFYYV
jgi:hypothetical protein